MAAPTEASLINAVRDAAVPLAEGDPHDALLELIGDARFVLLGEASHGTREFYRERARITRRLIAEKGFNAVAVEGDWPDTWQLNRYVRNLQPGLDAARALAGFERFPTWMWRNTEVQAFIIWLRQFNASHHAHHQAGFYGLDLYSLHRSMAEVLAFLEHAAPLAAQRMRERYACFDHFGDDAQVYGFMTGLRGVKGCQDDVLAALVALRQQAADALAAGSASAEEAFDAQQNARAVQSAEAYYRGMYLREESTWNLRNQHMANTLAQLDQHLSTAGAPAKIVVWAHNSHLGDARATEMGERRGELNLGQLVRERHPGDCCLVGFTTHTGSVTAAHDWDMPAQRMRVLPSRSDSFEMIMHRCGASKFLLPLRGDAEHVYMLRAPRLQRAIGVVYRPQSERLSHYFSARLADQFDAVVHIDETHALQPLAPGPAWRETLEVPETYPSGV
jgi:erythromycin esterase-like protein